MQRSLQPSPVAAHEARAAGGYPIAMELALCSFAQCHDNRRSESPPMGLGIAALLVLALSGCGKAAAPAPSASVTQTWDPTAADSACQVVTEHDASSALGIIPRPGVPSSSQNPSGAPCTYTTVCTETVKRGFGRGQHQSSGRVRLRHQLTVDHRESGSGAARRNRPGGIYRVRQQPGPGPATGMWRFKGSATFAAAVTLNGRDQAAVRQLAVDLARAAADRM